MNQGIASVVALTATTLAVPWFIQGSFYNALQTSDDEITTSEHVTTHY